MTKVLSLVWYKVLPPKFGGQKGIALFNEHLSRHCKLTCLCSKDNQVTKDISYRVLADLPTGRKHVLNPFYWWKVRQITKKEKPSLLILEHPYHGLAAFLAQKHSKQGFALHAHNIEWRRFQQIGKWWWPLLKAYEKWVFRRAAFVIFKTSTDQNFAIRSFGISPEKCMIIPYGVDRPFPTPRHDETIRKRYHISADEKLLLFAGTLDYEPNAKAVEDIYKEIIPRLKASGLRFRIIICGRNKFPAFAYLNDLNDPCVIMAGEQDMITPFFLAADVFINPVLSGGGIQTKNMDALAHDCNTVCFSALATGIPPEICGGKLRIAEDGNWNEFIKLVIDLSALRSPTPDLFFAYFNWARLLQPLIRKLPGND